MNHKRIFPLLFAFAAFNAGSDAYAHNGIEHLLGTMVAMTDNTIIVETVKHAKVTLAIDSTTTFVHGDEKASLKGLKKGDRVAIDAKENTEKKLVALAVWWGGSGTGTQGHAERKN